MLESGPWTVSPTRAGNTTQALLHIDKDHGQRRGKGPVLPEEIKGLVVCGLESRRARVEAAITEARKESSPELPLRPKSLTLTVRRSHWNDHSLATYATEKNGA